MTVFLYTCDGLETKVTCSSPMHFLRYVFQSDSKWPVVTLRSFLAVVGTVTNAEGHIRKYIVNVYMQACIWYRLLGANAHTFVSE